MAGVVVATLVLLALAAAAAWALLRWGPPAMHLLEPSDAARRSHRATNGGGHVTRLVFAEIQPDSFAVDGVLESGAPLSLRFRRPGTWWFAECVGELLCGWAETDEVVELHVDVEGETKRATVSNGSSAVTLDLDHVEGLPAAA